MAEVASAMGEVDEIHSNDDSSVMVNGDATKETGDDDVDMVDVKKLPMEDEEEDDEEMKPEEDDSKDVEMTSQSNIDSEDSQDAKSSQSSQENGDVVNEDTNSSSMQNENSNVSSARNDDDEDEEDSGSSSSSSDSKADDNSQEATNEKTEPESKKTEDKMEISENGLEATSPASSAEDDVQEIVKPHDTIELNSEDESDIQILDAKTNGNQDVIDLIDSPEKKTPPMKNLKRTSVTPRRSSRNVNKSKSYVENENDAPAKDSGESDIEEVLPQDPLADNNQITVERVPMVKKQTPEQKASTIVVKDTKRLVEIANKTNQSGGSVSGGQSGGKKEPTLVIIDTNSILSGRGPVPAAPSVKPPSNYANVLPMAVPAQGLYPANMRATITPIPSSGGGQHHKNVSASAQQQQQASAAPLLPTLTDDMFVVEAPSFIVPYVYEKPPVKVLKEYIAEIKKQIEDNKKAEKAQKRAKKLEKKQKGKEDEDASDDATSSSDEDVELVKPEPKKPYSYFESPLGKFFTDIGCNLVQEYVQTDLLKQQKRKRDREQGSNAETNKTISTLIKTIEMSRSTNQHYKMEIKKCEFCNFKTESKLAMAYHLETPHMKNFVYKCNFCAYEVRSPHDILFHMEAEHAVRGHLERAPAFHQCPSCPFEDNQKGKLSRHLVVCARKFKPDRNLEPPPDWEPPAKIPRMPKMRATGLNAAVAAYQTLNNKGAQQYQFLSKMQLQQANATASTSALNRGRGRPTLGPNVKSQPMIRPQGMIFKQQSGGQMLVPANYQLAAAGNQVYQVVGGSELGGRLGSVPGMAFVPSSAQATGSSSLQPTTSQQQTSKKPSSNTPSISITPLPRTSSSAAAAPASGAASKPGDTSSKNSFVICEICDGYIKDLEQLRNHMQWIHKIKIHPKMIYNRPPLNCQKCQFRFFTDQGLERHLLGSHGLVTSSMQDNANKSKDSGRCPVCGRVYQWKLLNHVARDHNMTLKPAHLSYKCTVCTATFGMYKQFENHVYSAHSVVAKRVMDKKTTSAASASSTKNSDMKPLKINDEITIIPQPAKSTNGKEGGKSGATAGSSKSR